MGTILVSPRSLTIKRHTTLPMYFLYRIKSLTNDRNDGTRTPMRSALMNGLAPLFYLSQSVSAALRVNNPTFMGSWAQDTHTTTTTDDRMQDQSHCQQLIHCLMSS
eukprot:scaffold248548_cov77-Cyclotella_meneghiniana.AAC.3